MRRLITLSTTKSTSHNVHLHHTKCIGTVGRSVNLKSIPSAQWPSTLFASSSSSAQTRFFSTSHFRYQEVDDAVPPPVAQEKKPRATKAKKQLVLRPADYDLIDSDDKLNEWIQRIKDSGICSFSTQISVAEMHEKNLVGISFCVDPESASCYVPLLHRDEDVNFLSSVQIVSSHAWFQKIKEEIFENESIKKVAHNVKEHIKRLYPYGSTIKNFDDIMVMSYVLDCGKHDHDFETLMEVVLDEKPKEILLAEKEVLGIGKKKVTFTKAPIIPATHYVCQYADFTAKIYAKLEPQLTSNARLVQFYNGIELPLVRTLSAIELQGVMIDRPGLEAMAKKYQEDIFQTANLIRKEAGYPEISREELVIADPEEEVESKSSKVPDEEFNVNSNRQLGVAIFDKMRIGREYAKKSPKTGDYVMNAEVLELLAKHYPIAKYILQYRAMSKLYSTYIYGLQQHVNPYTGRIHTTFQNALTVTGRLSSVSPNLQNIPVRTSEGKMIRQSFMASDGHVILKVDYSQVELRILAHIANIQVLKDAFRDGKDVHAITASQVFKVPVEGIDKSLRNKAKAINFGIIYGMSEYGLAKRIEVSVPTAKQFIEKYFEQYPGIQKYMERTKKFCREHGYVNTLFGRKCWIPDINNANQAKKGFAERTCINTPIQGTSADITKIAMNRLFSKFQELDIRTKMIIQVHDEIVFEAPEDEVELVKPIIKEIMEGAAAESGFSVPLTVDIETHKRWLEV